MIFFIKNLKHKYFLFTYWFLITISCQTKNSEDPYENLISNHNSILQYEDLGRDQESSSKKTNFFDEINYEKGEKVLIVMVYGLNFSPGSLVSKNSLKLVANSLTKRHPNSNLEFLYVEFEKSVNLSLIDQGRIIHDQIQDLFNKNKHKYNKDTKILFIGHCTGGLAAYETYKMYEKQYNIVGILSAGAPWEGADFITNGSKQVTWLFKLTFGLQLTLHYGKRKPSIVEITPDSCYLKSLEKSLEDCKIPIWALGGKTDYYREFLTSKLGKFLIKKSATEENIFGSKDHDGIVKLNSQVASKYPKVKSIILDQPLNHSTGVKKGIISGMRTIIKRFKYIISPEDAKKMLYIENEPSITETDTYLNIVNLFIEKYGLYPQKKYIDDDKMIKKIQFVN